MKYDGYETHAPKIYKKLLDVQVGVATTGVVDPAVKNLMSVYMGTEPWLRVLCRPAYQVRR